MELWALCGCVANIFRWQARPVSALSYSDLRNPTQKDIYPLEDGSFFVCAAFASGYTCRHKHTHTYTKIVYIGGSWILMLFTFPSMWIHVQT